MLKALRWSWQGLRAAWLHESSFRLEVVLAVPMVLVGSWLGHGAVEKILLVGPLLLVMAVELLNSAIEALIARYGDEWNELAGRAKDMGSAAVFLLLLNVLLCWGLILGARLL